MKLKDIRIKSESKLKDGRGRSRDYTKFDKLLAMYREEGKALNLEDVKKYLGLTLSTIRKYAKDRGVTAHVRRDDSHELFIIFEKE
ncbi:MAG: hypothetical protein ACOC38_10670 [Promethearchaeia archaeon]